MTSDPSTSLRAGERGATKTIAIIDYGMGNLASVQKALEKVGGDAYITQNPQQISAAAKVVLPGVGAIKPAMDRLAELALIPAIRQTVDSGKPFLGICLGLQLLFESSDEGGKVQGLGIFKGTVRRFRRGLKVPHMGWNRILLRQKDCPLFRGLEKGSYTYFCHSYLVCPEEPSLTATATDYGGEFTSSVWRKNIFGVQFHPEKSQGVGLKILENFVKLKSEV